MQVMQIYTLPNCGWCDRAKALADGEFDIIESSFYEPSMWDWENLLGFVPKTAPQIFIDGEYIGGFADFEEYLCK